MTMMDNAHALVVGIANYQHISGLPEAVLNDVRDVHTLLTKPDICGYPSNNATLLLNDKATLPELRKALADLALRTDGDSSVFIYFSCHGGRIEKGPDAGEYLLTVDTQIKPNVHPPEPVPETALSGNEFSAALEALSARKVVVLFDCCHSAGLGSVKAGIGTTFKAGLSENYYEKLAVGRGRVILSSSREDEYSYILPGDANSLFTKHLKAGLQGGAPSRDGFINIFALFEYIQPRVTSDESRQHPVLQVKVEQNFPIALFLGGQKAPVATSGADGEFRYDAYISWVRAPEDTVWVRDKLLPVLKSAGLQRLAMTGRVDEPGIPAVVGVQRAVELSKRTVIVLSRSYLESGWADLENVAAQHLSIEEQRARILPVIIDEALLDQYRYLNRSVPLGLRQLAALDLVDDMYGEENLARLPEILKGPIPAT